MRMGNAFASRDLERTVPRPTVVIRVTVDMVVMVVMFTSVMAMMMAMVVMR